MLVHATWAGAQGAFIVAGGATVPVGSLGDVTDIGYNAALGVELGGAAVPVGARLELAYNELGSKGGAGTVRLITGTANAIFNVGTTRDAPYLIAGVGAYSRSAGSGASGYATQQTVAGVNGGVGLRFALTGLSTFVEARYHMMLGTAAEGTHYQFVPIAFGIAF